MGAKGGGSGRAASSHTATDSNPPSGGRGGGRSPQLNDSPKLPSPGGTKKAVQWQAVGSPPRTSSQRGYESIAPRDWACLRRRRPVSGSISTQLGAEKASRELRGECARHRDGKRKQPSPTITWAGRGPSRPSINWAQEYLGESLLQQVLQFQSRCRRPLLLHSAHHALRHGRAPRHREQLTPASPPSSGCSCCFRTLLVTGYVCARRLLGLHYLNIPPLPNFFLCFLFSHTAVRGVRSGAGAKRSLLRPCPMLLTSVAGSSELPCSRLPGMLTSVAVCSIEWP
jgi:hypothetical protein